MINRDPETVANEFIYNNNQFKYIGETVADWCREQNGILCGL